VRHREQRKEVVLAGIYIGRTIRGALLDHVKRLRT